MSELPGRPDLVGEALVEALRPLVAALVAEELERRDHARQVEWLTVEEFAERRRTTAAAVHKRLARGQVAGAVREGRRWLIPAEGGTLSGHNNRGERRANGPAPGTRR